VQTKKNNHQHYIKQTKKFIKNVYKQNPNLNGQLKTYKENQLKENKIIKNKQKTK
jgi:hypothetical protein